MTRKLRVLKRETPLEKSVRFSRVETGKDKINAVHLMVKSYRQRGVLKAIPSVKEEQSIILVRAGDSEPVGIVEKTKDQVIHFHFSPVKGVQKIREQALLKLLREEKGTIKFVNPPMEAIKTVRMLAARYRNTPYTIEYSLKKIGGAEILEVRRVKRKE